MPMYDIPTDGCNMEIMGYPFFAESVSPNEAFRRREYNFNNIVGGTQKVVPGAYVGLDFTVTTHVFIDPERPDEHNNIFEEMMSKPVEVISPEFGGRFNAIVTIKPEHEKLDYLKLTISIREVPDAKSLIPGEEVTTPAPREVENAKGETNTNANSTSSKGILNQLRERGLIGTNATKSSVGTASSLLSKVNSIAKKTKGSE